jgi:hypothetical protein
MDGRREDFFERYRFSPDRDGRRSTLVEEQQGREGRKRNGMEWNGMDWEERVSVQQLNNCNVILPCFTCKYYNHDLNVSKLMKGKHLNQSGSLMSTITAFPKICEILLTKPVIFLSIQKGEK